MSDDYASSETGVQRLLAQLGKSHPRYAEALTLQWRLLDNISQARRYGDTETRSAGRAQIVDVLNQLALETTGQSFNEFCRLPRDEPPEPPPPPGTMQITIQIEVTIKGELSDFTPEKRQIFLDGLASVLRVESSNIPILRVQPGSVRVIIEVPEEALTRLKSLSLADKIKLARLGVQAIEGDNVRLVLPNIPTVPIIRPLYAWYHSLAPALQVAIIVALIGLFGTLAGTLGVPVVEWLLERPTPTAVAAATSTPTPTVTPTVPPTPTSTSTPTFTPTPSPTSTPTPTPTPDCSGVQVAYFELVLLTGTGQVSVSVQKDPDATGMIILRPYEIDGLQNLSGRAMFGVTNIPGGCTCDWQGKTQAVGPWTPINSIEDCSFSIDLPDQVSTINLQLTIGGQPPPKLFTIKVQP